MVVRGVDAGKQAELPPDRALVVGTATGVDLQLGDDAVSRYHLELQPVAGGVAIRDLGSLNGTYAGAIRVEKVVVPVPALVRAPRHDAAKCGRGH